MIASSFIGMRKRYIRSVSIPIFAIGLFLIAIFVASCGDEGDITEDTSDMTDVLQPTPTPPPPQTPVPPADPGGVEQPVVEEPIVAGISFKDDIQPILAERCSNPGCHAAPVGGGLDLTQYDTFKKGGNTGPGFIAGDGKGSLVVKRIDGGGMPLGGPPLDGDQVQLFIDWIDEGGENN